MKTTSQVSISIAMTTYNGEKFLQEQLDSFLKQTKLPDELVICDDKSNDNTLGILQRFKEKAPFHVKIYQNEENIGYIKNFEKAIEYAEGEIIFLSDQDDVWLSNKIKELSAVFKQESMPLLAINDQEIVGEDLSPTGVTRLGNLKKAGFSNDIFMTGCCSAFHTDLKSLIIPIPYERATHDIWIHKLSHYLNKRYVLDKTLQYYRRHESNVSSSSIKSIKNLNIFEFYRNGLKNKKKSYRYDIDLLEKVKERLGENIHKVDIITNDIIKAIENELSVLQKRNELYDYGFLKKSIKASWMLLNGDYHRYFNGYKSYFKDLI